MIQVKNLTKNYPSEHGPLTVLDNINFSIPKGQSVAIVGPSGSGKSTLLALMAGLDRPSSGELELLGNRLENMGENELALFRSQYVGFVFQSFHLLPSLTALENVQVSLDLKKNGNGKDHQNAASLWLEKVGLQDREDHYPHQLSGGERQRVAIARAFANSPEILFADEPTGNLDQENGDRIIDQLFELNHNSGITMVLVTHSLELAQKTERVIELSRGKVVRDN